MFLNVYMVKKKNEKIGRSTYSSIQCVARTDSSFVLKYKNCTIKEIHHYPYYQLT